ncbi:MAG: hypothetical protein AB7U98_10315 [Candidatus Nitrosocosmicus sp.]
MNKFTLPFEVSKSETTEKKVLSGLKKIEIYIAPEMTNDVIQILDELKLEATLYSSQGFGKSKQILRAGKSGGQNRIIAPDRKTVVTIAEASILEDLIKKIKHLNDTRNTKIGVLSIQSVDAMMHL